MSDSDGPGQGVFCPGEEVVIVEGQKNSSMNFVYDKVYGPSVTQGTSWSVTTILCTLDKLHIIGGFSGCGRCLCKPELLCALQNKFSWMFSHLFDP